MQSTSENKANARYKLQRAAELALSCSCALSAVLCRAGADVLRAFRFGCPFLCSACTLQGPTRPELRIGNLVIQGRLVQLPKPLLVLTTRRLKEEEGDAAGSSLQSQSQKEGARSPLGGSASKRKRGDAGDEDGEGSKKPRSSAADVSASASSASSSSSTFPSACLQTVAVIRHKYTFTHRPYAICDMGTVAPTQSVAKQEAKTHTTPNKTK